MADKKVTFFTDENGLHSMRRLLAFILTLTAIAVCGASLYFKASWQVILVAAGLPLAAAILMLFFTTWGDLGSLADKIHK